MGKDVQLTSGAYAQREASLMASEEAGEIEFVACTNDGTQDAIRWLIGLKNIYSKQLPNMPREYIARLVLDRNHRSVALVRRAREGRMCWAEPVGGITYRRFGPQGLGEISFCAITADEQVKGFGTRLMNHVKEFAKTDGMEFFLTYADNNAVGYFKKQGFTKEISMPEARWKGYIKDYDGGTLMECLLHPGIDYTRIPQAVAAQRERVEAAVREKTNSHVVREGLDAEFAAARMKRRRVTAEGGGGDGSAGQGHACLDPMSIPGVREAGWEPPKGLGSRVEYQGGARKLMQDSFAALRSHKDAWPFEDSIEVLLKQKAALERELHAERSSRKSSPPSADSSAGAVVAVSTSTIEAGTCTSPGRFASSKEAAAKARVKELEVRIKELEGRLSNLKESARLISRGREEAVKSLAEEREKKEEARRESAALREELATLVHELAHLGSGGNSEVDTPGTGEGVRTAGSAASSAADAAPRTPAMRSMSQRVADAFASLTPVAASPKAVVTAEEDKENFVAAAVADSKGSRKPHAPVSSPRAGRPQGGARKFGTPLKEKCNK